MIGKCSRSTYFGTLASDGVLNRFGGQRRQLSGKDRKSQSILSALGAPRPKETENNTKKAPTKSPAKDSSDAKGRLSFLSEVEQFLQKERSASSANSSYNDNKRHKHSPNLSRIGGNYAQKSIFDVFKVPDPAPQRSENAYDAEAFDAYVASVNAYFETMDTKEVKRSNAVIDQESRDSVKNWLLEEQPRMKDRLPTLLSYFREGAVNLPNKTVRKSIKKQLQKDLTKQQQAFQRELGWGEKKYKYATELLHVIATSSLEKHDALPIVIVWEKAIEMGCLQKETIEACLQVATSFSGSVLSRNRSSLLRNPANNSLLDLLSNKNDATKNSSKEDELEKGADFNVPEKLAMANDLLYTPTDHSTSILVRRLISIGDPDSASDLIVARMKGETKWRAYSQVFNLRLELGDVKGALMLMNKMMKRKNQKLQKMPPLQSEQFVQLIAVSAEKGYFCRAKDESLLELGVKVSGPALFDRLVSQMSIYVDSITSASAKRLQKAFERGFSDDRANEGGVDLKALAPLKPLKEAIPETQLVADRVSVDTSTGYCVSSGARLRLIDLKPKQKRQLQQGLLDLGQDKIRHTKSLTAFWDWLADRKGEKFTAIIDGANVAYYMQNFDRGRFNFGQIEFVVAALKEKDLNPLVILPYKYTQKSFQVTLGTATRPQKATSNDRLILERLVKEGRIYSVPQGCLDDYFWISATVADQGDQGNSKGATESDYDGLGSGEHPLVITNDQIRDHKEFELLETKVFNRWYSNTIVNYSFTGFVGDECVDPEIAFNPADTFSREIQRNECSTGQKAWHFPVSDWETADWFCVRIPSAPTSND